MISEWVDSLIGVFSPAAAVQRAAARQRLSMLKSSKRAYDAARVDRTTNPWVANSTSADRALYGEAERVRNRVRDLIRNNAYARGAVDAIVANVVGCGICPKPAIEDDPERNSAIAKKWNEWCETADITGRLHFCEMQALALREVCETGNALINQVLDQPGPLNAVPLALELIEDERLASETTLYRGQYDGRIIRRGVEIDRSGKAVAYWLYPTTPDDLSAYGFAQAERVDAERIIHLFRQERIGQTRGISWLAPAVMCLRDLNMYLENELQASAVAACFSVVIKTVDSGASWGGPSAPDGQEQDSRGDTLTHLQPAGVTHLMPGEDVSVVNPMRPNASADAFLATMLRSVAVATGLSYELVSRDYSRCNYSSSRSSSLEDQRRFKPIQKFLIWKLCQPIYRLWFRQAVLAKEANPRNSSLDMFPSLSEYIAAPEAWTRCNWRCPGWAWVDPLKEVQAAALEVQEGFSSRGDIIEASGGDLRETFSELAEEADLAEQLGLVLGKQAGAMQIAEANSNSSQDAGATSNADEEGAVASED